MTQNGKRSPSFTGRYGIKLLGTKLGQDGRDREGLIDGAVDGFVDGMLLCEQLSKMVIIDKALSMESRWGQRRCSTTWQ